MFADHHPDVHDMLFEKRKKEKTMRQWKVVFFSTFLGLVPTCGHQVVLVNQGPQKITLNLKTFRTPNQEFNNAIYEANKAENNPGLNCKRICIQWLPATVNGEKIKGVFTLDLRHFGQGYYQAEVKGKKTGNLVRRISKNIELKRAPLTNLAGIGSLTFSVPYDLLSYTPLFLFFVFFFVGLRKSKKSFEEIEEAQIEGEVQDSDEPSQENFYKSFGISAPDHPAASSGTAPPQPPPLPEIPPVISHNPPQRGGGGLQPKQPGPNPAQTSILPRTKSRVQLQQTASQGGYTESTIPLRETSSRQSSPPPVQTRRIQEPSQAGITEAAHSKTQRTRLHRIGPIPCPQCSMQNSEEKENCSSCGTPLYMSCPHCKRKTPAGNKNCEHQGCGFFLTQ